MDDEFFNPFGGEQEPQCVKLDALSKNGWKNKGGTSDRECPICGSWKTHWERISGKKFGKCLKEGCPNRAEVGAHIFRPSDGQKEWIVPFCKECNNPSNTGLFNLEVVTILVSAVKCRYVSN